MLRIMITALAGAMLGAGCQTTPGPVASGKAAGVVEVIAHRGASAYAPENTLPAFELAHEMGAEWFELDCMLSADGEVVVFHDRDTERIAGVAQPVIEQDLATLRSHDVGSWFSPDFAGIGMPTLGEALDFAKDRIGVYVEIKSSDDDSVLHAMLWQEIESAEAMSPELATRLLNLVEASGTRNLPLTRKVIEAIRFRDMANEIVIQSFSPVVCLVARQEAPEMRVELLGADDQDHPERWPMLLHFARVFGVHGFNAHHDSLNPERIRAFQEQGMRVATWTVNDPARMAEVARWGVNAIITDKPDLCREVLLSKGLASNAPSSE